MAGKIPTHTANAPITFIGIDPGDVWCGLAVLTLAGRAWHAQTMVIDRRPRDFFRTIDTLLHALPATVIVERYHQRPVGHQAWSKGETLQLIGGLRYVTERTAGAAWYTVAPGDPDLELPRLLIGDYLTKWRAYWPLAANPLWHHGRAAWRVIARYMLLSYPDMWGVLARPTVLASLRVSPPDAATQNDEALNTFIAPRAAWIVAKR